MMEVGRICMKIAGRDANNMCVVVELLDNNYVLIDGETRRKKCNIKHLEPTKKVIKLKSGASRSEVKKSFQDLGLGFFEPKSKTHEARVKKTKAKKEKVEKPKAKKTEKKTETKEQKIKEKIESEKTTPKNEVVKDKLKDEKK